MTVTTARCSLSLPPLDRPADVAARVASVLRVAIVGGDLAAGERLVPERIAEELGVSRPPGMAARRQLQRAGHVTTGGNGRPFAGGPSTKCGRARYRCRLPSDA